MRSGTLRLLTPCIAILLLLFILTQEQPQAEYSVINWVIEWNKSLTSLAEVNKSVSVSLRWQLAQNVTNLTFWGLLGEGLEARNLELISTKKYMVQPLGNFSSYEWVNVTMELKPLENGTFYVPLYFSGVLQTVGKPHRWEAGSVTFKVI